MRVRVFLHIRLLVEPFAAVRTLKRTFTAVDHAMCGQRRGTLEALLAQRALETSLLVRFTVACFSLLRRYLGDSSFIVVRLRCRQAGLAAVDGP